MPAIVLPERSLPKGWALARLRDITISVERGKSPKYVDQSQFPVLNQRCIRWEGIDFSHLKFVDPRTRDLWGEDKILRRGDVLLNSTGMGTVGRAAVFYGTSEYKEVVVDSHVTVLRTTSALLPEFLAYLIRSPQFQELVAQTQSGSTNQVELSKRKLVELEIPVAPLEVQAWIVEYLNNLYYKISLAEESISQSINLLHDLKRRMLSDLYNGTLLSGLNHPPMDTVSGVSKNITYGTSKKSRIDGGGTAVLRIPNVVSGSLNLDEVKYAVLDTKEHSRLSLVEGDLLLVRSNGSEKLVGRGAVVPKEIEGYAFAGYLLRVRPDKALIVPEYLNYCLQSPQVRQIIERSLKSTTGVNNINAQEIGRLPIPRPGIAKQQACVKFLDRQFIRMAGAIREGEAALSELKDFERMAVRNVYSGNVVGPEFAIHADAAIIAANASDQKPQKKATTLKIRDAGTKMSLKEQILQVSIDWPEQGVTFEQLRESIGGDYEILVSTLVDLLRGDSPHLENVFDPTDHILKIRIRNR